jgi:hypothetical protein
MGMDGRHFLYTVPATLNSINPEAFKAGNLCCVYNSSSVYFFLDFFNCALYLL